MKNEKLKRSLSLFGAFFKIGAVTFGGGIAMLPIIQHDICKKHGWIEEDELLEMTAISESTPGPIAINMATYVGYRVAGFWGAFCATLGTVLPSFIIILIISTFLRRFYDYKIVRYAFNGIRAGVLALIVRAFFMLAKKAKKNLFLYIVATLAFSAVAIFGVNVFVVIIASAIVGLCATLIEKLRVGDKNDIS